MLTPKVEQVAERTIWISVCLAPVITEYVVSAG